MPNDMRWLNDHAGKRATPYPHELVTPAPPACLDCGATLANPLRTYCNTACARRHEARLQFAAMEAARHERRLGLRHFGEGGGAG
jgi:hypothetical protein